MRNDSELERSWREFKVALWEFWGAIYEALPVISIILLIGFLIGRCSGMTEMVL